MTLREKLLDILESEYYDPMTGEDLAKTFNLPPKDRKIFFMTLRDMEREGLIAEVNGTYLKAEEALIRGRLEGTASSFAFLVPDDGDEEDIFIPPTSLNGAIHGDTVLVKKTKEKDGEKSAEGEVVKLLSPVAVDLVGTLVKSGKFFFVEPNTGKYSQDVFVDKKYLAGARHNDKVVVKLIKRARGSKNPEGRVIERLGNRHQAGVEVTSIARDYDFPHSFSKKVLAEAKNLGGEPREKDLKGRTDFTDLFTITIDGEDAKDFDDAISIEKEGDNYRLYVHIADVSHYVKKGSAMDREAYKRGNSVYLLDRVIPMLPEGVCNGLCSLMPKRKRLTHTVEMLVDKRAKILSYDFHISFISSDRRLNYEEVSNFIDYDERFDDPILEEKLLQMNELREILYRSRVKRGALAFEIPESQIVVGKNGRVEAIFPRHRRVADQVIEEFMILANECVAQHFAHMEYPLIYRVHQDPDEDRVEDFRNLILPMGYNIKGKDVHAKDFQKILDQAKDKPEERLISTLLLRTMKKAIYTTDLEGHFGLASPYYTHFTAPIRRYGDLVVHRIFKDLVKSKLTYKNLDGLKEDMEAISVHISETERKAEEAERAVEDYMQTEYMREVVGRDFIGVVSSITSYGIYVELENTVEGLAAFRDQDDYYIFDKDSYKAIGRDSGRQVKIGQEVKVRVLGVDEMRNEIDFKIIKW